MCEESTNRIQNHKGGLIAPTIYKTMALDIIYPIILTPITIAVMYASHVLTKKSKREIQEATPYQFEKDEMVQGFNEVIQHQRQELYRMYKGNAK